MSRWTKTTFGLPKVDFAGFRVDKNNAPLPVVDRKKSALNARNRRVMVWGYRDTTAGGGLLLWRYFGAEKWTKEHQKRHEKRNKKRAAPGMNAAKEKPRKRGKRLFVFFPM